jgi:hypothetical protein
MKRMYYSYPKGRRDQLRKRKVKCKIQGTILRTNYDSTDEYVRKIYNKEGNIVHNKWAQRLSGTIQTTIGFFLCIPNEQ